MEVRIKMVRIIDDFFAGHNGIGEMKEPEALIQCKTVLTTDDIISISITNKSYQMEFIFW